MAEPTLTTPLHGRWDSLGAQLTSIDGWRVPERFGDGSVETRAALEGVALGDDTPRGKLLVQGQSAADVVAVATETAPAGVGEVAGHRLASYRLRPDLLFVATVADEREAALTALDHAARDAGGLVSVTDVTHGRFEYRIVGPASAELMSKVCSLDFDADAFPDRHAVETSVARIKALVVRADAGDLHAYRVLGGRALGAYVWDTLMQAGAEFGIAPIGWRALHDLNA